MMAIPGGEGAKPSTPRSILRRDAPIRSPVEQGTDRKRVTFEVRKELVSGFVSYGCKTRSAFQIQIRILDENCVVTLGSIITTVIITS